MQYVLSCSPALMLVSGRMAAVNGKYAPPPELHSGAEGMYHYSQD
jgi:hypothetical protein